MNRPVPFLLFSGMLLLFSACATVARLLALPEGIYVAGNGALYYLKGRRDLVKVSDLDPGTTACENGTFRHFLATAS